MLCIYAPGQAVTSRHVGQALQHAAVRFLIWQEGFDLERIGQHSIRASVAMTLFLNDTNESRIKLMGRWRSTTWLTYIHTQIAAFSSGLSRHMIRPVLAGNRAMQITGVSPNAR
jgi:hypothetical protein